ncbi:MAG: hypothetical protein ACXWP1_10020 [Bdellovibrionota bacterium]
MESERQFLHKLAHPVATAVLLSQLLRWGQEGCLGDQEGLPDLAIKLQECTEKISNLLGERRTELKRNQEKPEEC